MRRVRPSTDSSDDDPAPSIRRLLARARAAPAADARFWRRAVAALDGARAATTPPAGAAALSVSSGGVALAFFIARGLRHPTAVVVKVPPSRAAARAEALGAALTAALGARAAAGRVLTPADGSDWSALCAAAAAHAPALAAALDAARVALVLPLVTGARLDAAPAPRSRPARVAAAADLGALAVADLVLGTRDRTPDAAQAGGPGNASNVLVDASPYLSARVTGLDAAPARLPPAAAANDAAVAAAAAALVSAGAAALARVARPWRSAAAALAADQKAVTAFQRAAIAAARRARGLADVAADVAARLAAVVDAAVADAGPPPSPARPLSSRPPSAAAEDEATRAALRASSAFPAGSPQRLARERHTGALRAEAAALRGRVRAWAKMSRVRVPRLDTLGGWLDEAAAITLSDAHELRLRLEGVARRGRVVGAAVDG